MENEQVKDLTTSIAAIESAQTEQQIVTAKRFPRDEFAAVKKAIQLATYSNKTAQSCIYFRPVGKKDGRQTFAEGPSIRLAEVLKSSWGNLRLGTRVIGEKDGNIHVQAGCHDLENNVFETSEVARSITGRNGRYPESMVQVVIGAASNIARRNVIFSVIPKAHAEQIMDACKEAIVGDEENKEALISALEKSFAEMGVTKDMLESVIDRKEYAEGSNDEIVFLIGLHNAIKDNICTVDDVFGKQSSKPAGVKMPEEIKDDPKKKPPAKKTVKAKAPQETEPEEAPEAEKKTPPAQPSNVPSPETLRATALQAGITDEDELCNILTEKFGIATPEDVPPEKMSNVIDLFVAMQE